jgi:hypothetical protein
VLRATSFVGSSGRRSDTRVSTSLQLAVGTPHHTPSRPRDGQATLHPMACRSQRVSGVKEGMPQQRCSGMTTSTPFFSKLGRRSARVRDSVVHEAA